MQKLSLVVILGVGAAAASVAAQNPQTSAGQPSATGAIVGVVADEATGKPITGAVVTISPPFGTPAAARRENLQVLTSSDGRFLFTALAPGLYSFSTQKSGYLPASPGSSTGSLPMLIDLADGQIRSDVTIPMARPGAITGTIVDEAGDPVIGVQLQVARRARVRGRVLFVPTGGSTSATDDRGMYRVGNLAPGDYVVMIDQTLTNLPTAMIEAYQRSVETRRPGDTNPVAEELFMAGGMGSTPGTATGRLVDSQVQSLSRSSALVAGADAGGPTFVYPPIFYPAALTASRATVIAIRSGEERTGIDMVMRPARAISISGSVTGPNGPAALTAVTLTLADGLDATIGTARIGTTTDAAGRFTFLTVPAGDYVLRVTQVPTVATGNNVVMNSITSADGSTSFSVSSSGPAATPPLPPDPTLWAEMPVSAGSRDIVNLAVSLQPGARLSGRVTFEGALAPPTPQQLAGLRLSLQPASGMPRLLRMPRTRIDGQGQISSQGFPSGQYTIGVFGAPAGWSLLSIASKGVDVSQQPLEVGVSDISDLVVTFTDQPTELNGVVTARDGAAPKAAGVILFPADEPIAHDYGLNTRRVIGARASADGRYSFKGFPAGDYRVIAIDDVSVLADLSPELVQPLAQRATAVRISKGEKRQQNLTVVSK